MGSPGPPGFPAQHPAPSDIPNRGRSLLGAPPPLEPTPAGQQQGGGGAGQLEEQLNGLRSSVSSLQEQIRQSESNLTAQDGYWTGS